MVIPDCDAETTGDRGRGQLVLIGAIGLGLIIIGIVVVINTTLVSENLATSESLESADEVTKFSASSRINTRSIVLRLNHRARNQTAGQLGGWIRRNTSNYSLALAESHSLTGIAVTNLTYNNESSKWGTRLVQINDSAYTAPRQTPPGFGPSQDWRLFGGTADKPDVRRFILNLNVTATAEDPFTVRFENRTKSMEIDVEKTGGMIEITADANFGNGNDYTSTTTCDPSSDRVLINLMTGRSFTGDCSFDGVLNRSDQRRTLRPPYELVRITEGQRGNGQFSVVTNLSYDQFDPSPDPLPGYDHCAPSLSGDVGNPNDPCRSPIVWRANITTTYQSTSVDYWQRHTVSVYP